MKWPLFNSTMCRVVRYTTTGNQNSHHIHTAHYLMITFLKHRAAYIFIMLESLRVSPLNVELVSVYSPDLHSRYHIVLNFPTLPSTLTRYPLLIPISPDSRSSLSHAWSFPTSMNLHKHWLLLGILIFNFYQTPTYPSLKPISNLTSSKTVLSNMIAKATCGYLHLN